MTRGVAKRVLMIWLLAAGYHSTAAQVPIQDLSHELMVGQHPGIEAMVIHQQGRVVTAAVSFGIDEELPDLRSVTKSVTGMLAGRLEDRGVVDMNAPVSAYLGKPGSPDRGGLPIGEYRRRQEQFRHAEIYALLDTDYFIDRAERLYGYPHFVCDTGGSICEWVEAENPDDPVLSELARRTLMIWIKGDEAHTAELIRRFDKAPKPMSYQPEFLTRVWNEYLRENKCEEDEVDPDAFVRWTYAKALAHRQPRYEAMARNWGVTVTADQVAAIRDEGDFDDLVAEALERRARP